MSYFGWKPYVSVAERRKKAEKAAAKAQKSGAALSPIASYRGAIAKTFWGKAWCDNLEAYSDYASRLPRGRSYVRNGSVIDLKIMAGEVQARVMGSSLYQVAVKVTAVPAKQWQAIGADCAGSIDSLVELLHGKLSTSVMQRICAPRTGLFPAPKEMSFSCTCPDWASMCKHVAAVLYGVGARLDQKPDLLFSLRGVDAKDLVSQAGAGLPKSKKDMAIGKVLDHSMLADVFGLELDNEQAPAKSVGGRKKPAATQAVAKRPSKAKTVGAAVPSKKPVVNRKTAAVKKTVAVKKPVALKKRVAVKAPVKAVATSRKSAAGKSSANSAKVVLKTTAKKKAGKTTTTSK